MRMDVDICALSGEHMKRSISVTYVITFTQFISTILKLNLNFPLIMAIIIAIIIKYKLIILINL